MEVYILDDLLRRVAVIDRFESCIWTERWRDIGDFELVLPANRDARNRLRNGTRLATNESDYVMEVEYTENKHDDEGKQTFTAKGRSIEKILEERVATEGMQGLTDDSDWYIVGSPGSIARHIFQEICVNGILSPSDRIDFLKPGSMYPPNTIPESDIMFSAQIPINTVYGAIKELCDQYDMGFRLTRNLDKSELYFEIYTGHDRTAQQRIWPNVIFSPDLQNVKNTTEIQSTDNYKNVAYVFSKNGSETVYVDGAGPDTAGFDRRVLYVDAKDVDEPEGPALTSILKNKGLDALAEHRSVMAFDGEITQYSQYKYTRDYRLGDLVDMRNSDGATSVMRVTEQIFASDAEGDRSYPTLTLYATGDNDTWAASGDDIWEGDESTWDE